jgi:hypothetical protein
MEIIKKFPTGKAVNYNYISKLFKDNGLDENPTGQPSFWYDYLHKKLSKTVTFPNIKEGSISDSMRNMISTESIFIIPKHHDTSKDAENYQKLKEAFRKNMKEITGSDQIDEKYVNFGPKSFEFVNKFLDVIYENLSEYYNAKGELRVWLPSEIESDSYYEEYDYPHKYDIDNDIISPDGVYYLSDIEKYLKEKYDLDEKNFYDFIIKNMYIEGRHWERVFYISQESGKLNRGEKFGMKATENIEKILSVLEEDFKDDFIDSQYKPGLLIFIDYYKKINYEDDE